MEIQGKIIKLLEPQSGEGVKGTWRKQEYILQTPGEYQKSICFHVWGNNIDLLNIKQGEDLTVKISIESREYNGKWYTDVKCWGVIRPQTQAPNDTGFQEPEIVDHEQDPFMFE